MKFFQKRLIKKKNKNLILIKKKFYIKKNWIDNYKFLGYESHQGSYFAKFHPTQNV